MVTFLISIQNAIVIFARMHQHAIIGSFQTVDIKQWFKNVPIFLVDY
jgi:hypothetical protein